MGDGPWFWAAPFERDSEFGGRGFPSPIPPAALGFRTKGTPGAVVRTEWKTDDIWLRREFDLPNGDLGEVYLLLHHDEDAEVYMNGVLALKVNGYITDYEEFALTKEGRKALVPGKNVIAIHCHQTTGGQYIDAGFVRMKGGKKE